MAAVALTSAWLLAAALPAAAVGDYGLEAPSGTVTEATNVVAYVEQNAAESQTERIDRVETRFLRSGSQVGSTEGLQPAGQDVHQGGRTSRYRANLDPLASRWTGGQPMANGTYLLQVRIVSQVGQAPPQTSAWKERQVVLEVPPPRTTAEAKLQDPARGAIQVSWRPVGAELPDFRGYVIERSTNGGDWSQLRRVTVAKTSSDVDTVGEGEHRYRVTVVRSSASGGDLSSGPSAPSEPIRVGSAAPGPAGQAPGGPGAPADAPPDRIGIRRGGAGVGPRLGSDTAAPPAITAPGAQLPLAAPPAAGPAPGGDGYQQTLPYGDVGTQAVDGGLPVDESGEDGGTLTVFNRQLVARDVVVPLAAGLVLVLSALHIRRFLNP